MAKKAVLTEDSIYTNDPQEDKKELINQGIGSLVEQSISNVSNTNAPRTIVNTSN